MHSSKRPRDKGGPTGIEYGLVAALFLVGALAVLQMVHLI